MNKFYTFNSSNELVELECSFSLNKVRNSEHTWVWEDELGYFVKGVLDYHSDSSGFEKKKLEGVSRAFYTVNDAISRIKASSLTAVQKESAIKRVKALPKGCLFKSP